MRGAILLTPSSGKRAAEHSRVWFANVSADWRAFFSIRKYHSLFFDSPCIRNANRIERWFSLAHNWRSRHAKSPPSRRLSRRKMSNPQPELLNHGNVFGTFILSSKGRSCLLWRWRSGHPPDLDVTVVGINVPASNHSLLPWLSC